MISVEQAENAVKRCYENHIINNAEVSLSDAYYYSPNYMPDRRSRIRTYAATTPNRSGIAQCAGYLIEWRVTHPVKDWIKGKWPIPVYDYEAPATVETAFYRYA